MVFDNMRHGISLNTLTTGNIVDKKQVYDNRGSGILVDNRATNNTLTKNQGGGNGRFDGEDRNPQCDNNTWAGNQFVTFDEPCVVAGNTGRGGGNGGGPPANPGRATGRSSWLSGLDKPGFFISAAAASRAAREDETDGGLHR